MRKMSSYSPSEADSTDKPFGAFKNETSPGTQDGTQAVAEHLQDLYYPLYQIMQLAGITPNGVLEDGNTNKQFLSALCNITPVLHNSTSTYKANAIAINISSGKVYFYKSLVANNTASLSDTSSWQELLYIDSDGSIHFSKGIVDVGVTKSLLIHDRIYTGDDSSTKFATEIASYSSVWEWIQARIQAGNYDGIHVGDYIPFVLSAGTPGGISVAQQTMHAQIAGIDTYYGYGDTACGHHIDFITKTVIDSPCQWQPNDNNNGTSSQSNPYLSSKIYAWLNGVNNYTTSAYSSVAHGLNASGNGILQLLPSALRNVIIQKRQLLEQRYSSSSLLSFSTVWSWQDMGKLWLPSENEVYGCQAWSSGSFINGQTGYNAHGCQGAVQYPLFAATGGYTHNRIKTKSDGTTRANWWLSAVRAGSSAGACYVSGSGIADRNVCSDSSVYAPVCFRIG